MYIFQKLFLYDLPILFYYDGYAKVPNCLHPRACGEGAEGMAGGTPTLSQTGDPQQELLHSLLHPGPGHPDMFLHCANHVIQNAIDI